MELGAEIPVVLGRGPQDSTDRWFAVHPETNLFSEHSKPAPPAFVEVFQQIINGLPEQIALVDDRWIIVAVNPAWTKTAALYGYEALVPGTDYLAFCEARALEGHTPAGIAAEGIRELRRSGEPSFRFVYHGSDRWEGHAFQLCVNRLEIAGRTLFTITRYDVTELVHLRQLREEFSHSLIEHQAEERRRMAREVHDSTMQLLAGLGLSLGQLKHSRGLKATPDLVGEMEGLLGEAQRELRAISFLAHPPMISELGLATALRQLAGGFARRTGLEIKVHAEGDVTLSPSAEVAVYRMVQEALSNVHRHARATEVTVGLYHRRSVFHVVVADDGVGMPEKIRQGVGLSSMRARIVEIGGRLLIRPANPGTIVMASVPAHAELRAVGDLSLPDAGTAATPSRACAAAISCPHGHRDCIPAHVIVKEEWLPGPDSNRRPSD